MEAPAAPQPEEGKEEQKADPNALDNDLDLNLNERANNAKT